jgi:hypothetical protein
MSGLPLKVRFFDSSHYSREGSGVVSNLGDTGYADVTEYVSSLSWSFSTTSPYETISLSLEMPFYRTYHVIPTILDMPQTGFWVTLHEDSGNNQFGDFGRLLAWGRVDSLNVSQYADPQTGAKSAQVSLSASSWIHFVNDCQVIMTEAEVLPKTDRKRFPKARKAAERLWKAIGINAGEMASFFKGFEASGFPNLGRKKPWETGLLIDGGLGKAASSLYHEFAKKVPFPPALTGKLKGELVDSDDASLSFSGITQFLYATKHAYNTFNGDDPSLRDLARFGAHSVVPMGTASKLVVQQRQGGAWDFVQSTFGMDPNVVEMFPTLIEVPNQQRPFNAHKDTLVAGEKYKLGDENCPLIFGSYINAQGFECKMVPVILYRMKPIHDVSVKHPQFVSNAHNEDAEQLGDNKVPYRQTNTPAATVLEAGKYPHFALHPHDNNQANFPALEIPANKIFSLNFSLSESQRVTAVSCRPIMAKNEKAGVGFNSLRKPVISVGDLSDYGFRYFELNWDIAYSGNQSHFVYQAIAEYAYHLMDRKSKLGEGSISCDLYPEIRAGMWVSFAFKEMEDPFYGRVYVEEVEHSLQVQDNGGFQAETRISFSMGEFRPGFEGQATTFGTPEEFG